MKYTPKILRYSGIYQLLLVRSDPNFKLELKLPIQNLQTNEDDLKILKVKSTACQIFPEFET